MHRQQSLTEAKVPTMREMLLAHAILAIENASMADFSKLDPSSRKNASFNSLLRT